uniref:SecY-independent transporter protein n=1 Tax=Bangia fuscopurpurea TaxID=101920 RepID=A0A0E3GPH8_BANFU|nr:SecY-independent transporter protein [Bangia fuscopurpurea]AKA66475.1 SecY-independent transporter protein [Bangia fuscopurpurea]
MKLPLQLHLVELKFRLGYFLLSFAICFFVILNYSESILFLETYVFAYLMKKRFIATHITELFLTAIYISFNFSSIAIFPYVYYHCQSFFATGWYKAQAWLFSSVTTFVFIIFFLSLQFCYFFLLLYAFSFFSTWEIASTYALQIQLEVRIVTYTYWTLQTACFLSNIVCITFFYLLYFYLKDNMITLHKFLRSYRKHFLISICLFTSIFIPPEAFLQFIFISTTTLINELLFFVTCIFFAKNNV